MEIWKEISEYEGYQVSSEGGIRGKNGRLLKNRQDRYGYLQVCLMKNHKRHYVTAHRIVANAFIDNPNKYSEINHIDENKSNNSVSNLEWCTRKHNQNHGTLKDRHGKHRAIKVIQKDDAGNKVCVWGSMSAASINTGIPIDSISKACAGKMIHAGGYKWERI